MFKSSNVDAARVAAIKLSPDSEHWISPHSRAQPLFRQALQIAALHSEPEAKKVVTESDHRAATSAISFILTTATHTSAAFCSSIADLTAIIAVVVEEAYVHSSHLCC